MKFKMAIVIHGRFHGFDFARALLARGHDVTVFTNYPRWAAARFALPADRVRSFWLHGVLARAAWFLHQRHLAPYPEAWLHRLFGRWAAAQLLRERWDLVHSWSGVSEEIQRALADQPTRRLMMRGSAHIRTQARLLEEEQERTGIRQDRPSRWIIAREEREYALVDRIVVLSNFAYNSFVSEGISEDKLSRLPLGTQLAAFRPESEVVAARGRRILSGEPLRVLYVGALSLRKGLWDLTAAIEQLGGEGFDFRLVGPRLAEAAPLLARLRGRATLVAKVPQSDLPGVYAWGDVFVFPTIEDGYAVVLAQAAAAGLPIITTTNCAGPDLIREGQTGWIVPIRSASALVERLHWCGSHRAELAEIAERVYTEFQPRDWAEVAADFETLSLAVVGR